MKDSTWNLLVRLTGAVSRRTIGKEFDDIMCMGCSIVRKIDHATDSVFLTFDDGPNPVTTPQIIDALDRLAIKATFFCIGRQAMTYPALVRELSKAGHEIGNHTFNHPDLHRVRSARVRFELEEGRKALEDITGRPVPMFRAPLGHFRWELRNCGCPLVGWNVAPPWNEPSAKELAKWCIRDCTPGSIILLHDGLYGADAKLSDAVGSASGEALEILVPELMQRGFRFQTLMLS